MSDVLNSDVNIRTPQVVIPYPGPCETRECHDVFVYLRPETNNIRVESTLFRVVKNQHEFKDRIKLAYLANMPGDFIVENKIVEQHYKLQLYFATHGKEAFTNHMRLAFEAFFRESIDKARVVGSFEAMRILDMDYNELFNLWVPKEHMLEINGQTIKKFRDIYIVNYDIPAILHKNNKLTDIAVMIFRTDLKYEGIHQLIDNMGQALIDEHILDPGKPLSRIFHYSKGPFDQIRDAIGHLYTPEVKHISLKQIGFAHYLLQQGFSMYHILGAVRHPIMKFKQENGAIIEDDLFHYTANMSFQDAYHAFTTVHSQLIF
jgi:hypothetical protein